MEFPRYNLDALILRAKTWLGMKGMEPSSLAVYNTVARLRREELQDARHSAIRVPITPSEETHERQSADGPAEATADLPPASRRA